jgi:putative zinc finger/helix-turn-helix YgiT family protein
MRGFCPGCEKETDLDKINNVESIEVRGEPIDVAVEYFKCLSCGEEFDDPLAETGPVDKAYREYRRRHGMTQPEDITAFRNKYNLTQGELASLLGWGTATLSRYENGALQDEAHERALRLAMEPQNLLKLINEKEEALPHKKRARTVALLEAEDREINSFERILQKRFGRYEPDEYSGYRRLDLSKLFNAILHFCRGGVTKTKLNKELFYADFIHYARHANSITGLRYARAPYGPVPDNFECYYAVMINEDGTLRAEEKVYSDEASGEEYYAEKEPDLSAFTEPELKTLLDVKDRFKDFTAKKIVDLAHSERGYTETPTGKHISYKYAKELTGKAA